MHTIPAGPDRFPQEYSSLNQGFGGPQSQPPPKYGAPMQRQMQKPEFHSSANEMRPGQSQFGDEYRVSTNREAYQQSNAQHEQEEHKYGERDVPQVPAANMPGAQKKRGLNQMVSNMIESDRVKSNPVQKPVLNNASETVSEPDEDFDQPLPAQRFGDDPSDKSDHSKSSIHKEEPAGTKKLRRKERKSPERKKVTQKRAKTDDRL